MIVALTNRYLFIPSVRVKYRVLAWFLVHRHFRFVPARLST
jgi:hypothetical protein